MSKIRRKIKKGYLSLVNSLLPDSIKTCFIGLCSIFSVFIFFFPSNASAQDNTDNDTVGVMRDRIYKPTIATVLFNNEGVYNSDPIVQLRSADRLVLQFDDFDLKPHQYQYTLVHCDADWRPSKIYQSDYLDGIYQDNIDSVKFSNITFKRYIHYKLRVPSGHIRPKLSGNYIIKIYQDNESNLVLVRRFYVYESLAQIGVDPKRATYSKYAETKQEVDFQVNIAGISVADPFHDIKVVVKQNYRWDNEIRTLKPLYIQDKMLIYNYQEENLFDGGNEFRSFDLSSTQFKGVGVNYYVFDSFYYAYLFKDEDRSYTAYSTFIDQDGKYTINTKQGQMPENEADYINVHFSLTPTYGEDNDKSIFVFGALSDWDLEDKFKMKYNGRDKIYECDALLKQGFYDYEYVTVGKDGVIDASTYEGNHWETENSYTVFVYFRPLNLTADRLVGFLTVKTKGK